jgi:hypothetical protein
MAELRVYDLRGNAGGGSLRLHELSGTLTTSTQLRLAELSGTVTYAIVRAGADRTAIEPGSVVTLDGSATTGASTYQWTCISYGTSGPPSITNSTSAIASYTAPSEYDDVNLVFRLTVDSGATDVVTHHVVPQIEWTLNGSTWEPLAY